MNWFTFSFLLESVAIGFALAMDAFSVSLTNGLNEPHMKKSKMMSIAGTFSFFQIIMPLIGWFCVHEIAEKFEAFQKYIPWIALILLVFIGSKMLIEGIKGNSDDDEGSASAVGFGALMVQGIATSIDALSTGFTIANYHFPAALTESLIIGAVTLVICIGGLVAGKKIGTKLSGKASILGGLILIAIGIKIIVQALLG